MLKIIKESHALAIDAELLKSCCGIMSNDTRYDKELVTAIRQATRCVEDYSKRTLLCTTLEFSSNNRVMYLPRPLIQKVCQVSSNGEILAETEYRKHRVLDTIAIVLKHEYNGKENAIIYEAGYGDCWQSVPKVLNKMVFDCSRYLFEYPERLAQVKNYYQSHALHKTQFGSIHANVFSIDRNAGTSHFRS